MRHREVTGRTGRTRAALAGVLVGLLALPALPEVAAAQQPPAPDPAPTTEPASEPTSEPADEPADPTPAPADGTLGEADRTALAEARTTGEDVTLLVAATDGDVEAAARQLRALGAEVEVVDTEIDYLKATLPPEDAIAATKAPAVAAVDVDALIPVPDPVPAGTVPATPQTPPSAATPRANPYLPTADIGAPQFVAANPTWDGRGTVVAIIDSGVDLDSPALSATTPDGQPKIVGWRNTNGPQSGDGTWVSATGRHTGAFTADGRSWTAPATGGPYAFGILAEAALDLGGSEIGGDLDRDGTTGERIGVLQDRTTLDVYVDTDQDLDLTDETPMQPLSATNRDIGFLGVDDPATQVRERVGFTVGTHESNTDPASTAATAVSIGIAVGRHGTHVAGIATGDGLFGGAMDGVAPGAQVIAVDACLGIGGCTGSGILDGIVHAAQAGADVANMSIGGPTALNDGNNARGELIDRTIAEYDMQLVLSAGNEGPGANTVGEPSSSTTALTVGASITDDTWRSNYGSDSARAEALIPFSSQGPREDGGFKPDVVAPGSAVAPIPAWQGGLPIAGTYSLPPGYGHLNGTSMAAPQVAGAAALLVGAWKATHDGERPDPAALRDAITGSARPLPGIGVHEQGMGVVDVGAAWARLQGDHAPHAITASVPSGSPLAAFLRTPGFGTGIYERDGMVAGGPDRTRTYTVTRTSGPVGPLVLPVTWIGNDGTFTAPTYIALPRDVPVEVPVRISSATAGAHSAVMVIDDPATPGTDLATMNATFVGTPFVDGVATLSGTVPRNGTRHLFVAVPAGTPALTTTLEGGGAQAGAGQIRFLRYTPWGTGADPSQSTSCYTPDAGGGCAGSPTGRTITNPLGGIWEIVVEARRTSDTVEAPFTVRASIGQAGIAPRRWFTGALEAGGSASETHTVTNGPLPFRGRLTGGPLSSTYVGTPSIPEGGSQQRQIAVGAGTTSLTVRIGGPDDPAADLDLYLYNCSTGSCVLAGQSADSDAEEAVTVSNPPAGIWISLVEGFAVPTGTTSYDYRDSFTQPALGSVAVTDADADRGAGASWSAPSTVTLLTAPAAGRTATGTVRVVSDTGTTLGTGEVLVTAAGAATTTSLDSSPRPSTAGQPVTLTATVAGSGATPRGTVTFFDGGTPIGAAGVSSGVARMTTATLGAGTHQLTARYAAGGTHQDSTSAPVAHVVDATPEPVVPTADAGDDQVVDPGDAVTLDGRASDHPDDATLTYAWGQESGPPVTLLGTAVRPTFTAPDTTEPLTFRLVVTDPDGDTATDTVTVRVNQAPVAAAGSDALVDAGSVVALAATGSGDPDGDPVTYRWAQTAGPAVTLVNPTSTVTTFVAPASGTLTVRLTVDDGRRTTTDDVTVTVNGAPTADAGPDRRSNPGATVALDGTGSTDAQDAITHSWAQVSGPAVTLAGAATATPTLTTPAAGTLSFRLTVTDTRGLTDTDDVTVTVNDAPDADAGPDQVVATGAEVTLDATASSDPGDVLTYTWTQQSGPAVALSDTHVASPSFTAPAAPATLSFAVTVVDPLGRLDTDTVTVRVAPELSVTAELVGAPNPDTDLGLEATATGDTEGLAYAWTQTAGPAVTLAGADTATPTFRSPAGTGILAFSVTVTDGAGQTATDTVTFTLNRPPTAAAGSDQEADPGDEVELDGTGSADPEGAALTYAWTQTGGTAVTLVDATTATPGFTAPAGPTTITLRLSVTDVHGLTATDVVEVDVNGAPAVDAGADQVADQADEVTLDGTGTTDPDGDELEVIWAQESGPTVGVVDIRTLTPSFFAPAGPATLVFSLTATDARGVSATDTVTVTVNGRPVADAGPDQTVNPGATGTLDATGSTDPEAAALTYAWTQDSGPGVELSSWTAAQPTFTAPASGPLVFTVVVRDPRGESATDQVVVTVNGVPEADAGPARTVDESTGVTLDGRGSTDPDDEALTYAWTQTSGPAVALSGADTATPTFLAPAGSASLLFVLTVTDPHGAGDVAAVTITVVPPLTADEQWVVEAYSTFLQRVPDADGLAFWTDRLDRGVRRIDVLRSLALSVEGTRGPVVTDLYDRLLDRSAGADERDYWSGRLLGGTKYHWVERHLLASAERYDGSGGTDAAYVSDLYQRILGRSGGEDEIAYWVDRLERGAPRLHTVDALLNTPEARRARVAEVAESILGRPPTAAEAADLGATFAATRDPRTVAMAAFLLR